MIACQKAKFCYFPDEMLRISKGKETLTLKGDHLETNFKGFDQKSPMETSITIPVNITFF